MKWDAAEPGRAKWGVGLAFSDSEPVGVPVCHIWHGGLSSPGPGPFPAWTSVCPSVEQKGWTRNASAWGLVADLNLYLIGSHSLQPFLEEDTHFGSGTRPSQQGNQVTLWLGGGHTMRDTGYFKGES